MHPFQALLDEAGIESHSYSGRAMYGKECLAVDLDGSLGDFVANVIEETHAQVVGENLEAISEAFRSMKTDSMGRGIVVYFPGVPYESEGSEDDPDQKSRSDA
jgi:hypothetical protein